ncbi:MAG: hypothetical protein AMJ38_03270 [Dehalococcoidia bacterium DG_22]|nr:MAG: hypothetical protein AMJ38_03270 [Dehalococcoidia bacterium DG_22]
MPARELTGRREAVHVSQTRWVSILLAVILLLQPLACCKRVPVVTGGQTCPANEEQILYVTLIDGKQYELVDWEIGPDRVLGKRQMVKVTMNEDGTIDEEEYLEPTRFELTDVACLNLEKVDSNSFWVFGAIAGGVAGALAAMAALQGASGGGGSGSDDPGPIGNK